MKVCWLDNSEQLVNLTAAWLIYQNYYRWDTQIIGKCMKQQIVVIKQDLKNNYTFQEWTLNLIPWSCPLDSCSRPSPSNSMAMTSFHCTGKRIDITFDSSLYLSHQSICKLCQLYLQNIPKIQSFPGFCLLQPGEEGVLIISGLSGR